MTESDFSKRLGMPKRSLAEIRKGLAETIHWRRSGREVHWTVLGQADVLTAVTAAENTPSIPDGAQCASAPEQAKVMKKPRNRRVLVALLAGEQIIVRVRDSAKYPVGFVVPVRPIEGIDARMYELARKEPRWYGRW